MAEGDVETISWLAKGRGEVVLKEVASGEGVRLVLSGEACHEEVIWTALLYFLLVQ